MSILKHGGHKLAKMQPLRKLRSGVKIISMLQVSNVPMMIVGYGSIIKIKLKNKVLRADVKKQ